jgi:hypothetical protein
VLGVPIREADFSAYDAAVGGCVRAHIEDGFAGIEVIVRSGLAADLKTSFAEWAESRINRFLERGPEPDGWQRTPDGVWQLCARQEALPSLD